MTAQVGDSLKFEGRLYSLSCEPLGLWLQRKKNIRDKTLRFKHTNTACSRGYVARWEIARGRLYMKSCSGRLIDGSPPTQEALFANYSKQYLDSLGANDPANAGPGIFAFWVTGVVWCTFGELLEYDHCGYESIYQGEIHLWMKDGFVIGQRIVHREKPARSELDELEDEFDELEDL